MANFTIESLEAHRNFEAKLIIRAALILANADESYSHIKEVQVSEEHVVIVYTYGSDTEYYWAMRIADFISAGE